MTSPDLTIAGMRAYAAGLDYAWTEWVDVEVTELATAARDALVALADRAAGGGTDASAPDTSGADGWEDLYPTQPAADAPVVQSPPVAPRTPVQRDAVARLIEHGAVYVSGRGERRGPAHVTGAMSSWLQRNGWADWDYSGRGLPLLMVVTRAPGVSGERAIRPTPNAQQCGACGRFWREPTPGGRCPWEDLHPGE